VPISDPLGDPGGGPAGVAPKTLDRHLAAHCRIEHGYVSDRWAETDWAYPAEGRNYQTTTRYLAVAFPKPHVLYKVTVQDSFWFGVVRGFRDLNVGHEVQVHCCPYYPSKVYAIEWRPGETSYVCPRHRPPASRWHRIVHWRRYL